MSRSVPKKRRKFTELKSTVVALRKNGKTYGEIREIYNIPKSTLSNWLENVEIPEGALIQMRKKAYERWFEKNKIYSDFRSRKAAEIREKYTQEAFGEIEKISEKELKLIGAALYWAEGSKSKRNQLRFSNSDPEIIKVIMKFFRDICKVPDEKIKPRVHIYPRINYRKALNFWSETTNLPKNNFYAPQTQISIASKSKRPRNTLPYGTLHLTVGNTELASKVKGWIQGIAEKI